MVVENFVRIHLKNRVGSYSELYFILIFKKRIGKVKVVVAECYVKVNKLYISLNLKTEIHSLFCLFQI